VSARKTADPVMARLSCRHAIEVTGRAQGDRVPCYLCPETKSGAAVRTVKELRHPAPVEPAPPKRAKAKKATPQPAASKRASGSSRRDGPPPRCSGVGQEGLDGPGTGRCPVCSQDLAPVRRDGTLGSHKQLRPRGGDLPHA
jgi:hypothetical protein